uniref:L-type lectin-like domain-containing protein n=1 Tax=Macrostomum lignano TaxID=282301 RepID=A0A1I8H8E3_9PLAT
ILLKQAPTIQKRIEPVRPHHNFASVILSGRQPSAIGHSQFRMLAVLSVRQKQQVLQCVVDPMGRGAFGGVADNQDADLISFRQIVAPPNSDSPDMLSSRPTVRVNDDSSVSQLRRFIDSLGCSLQAPDIFVAVVQHSLQQLEQLQIDISAESQSALQFTVREVCLIAMRIGGTVLAGSFTLPAAQQIPAGSPVQYKALQFWQRLLMRQLMDLWLRPGLEKLRQSRGRTVLGDWSRKTQRVVMLTMAVIEKLHGGNCRSSCSWSLLHQLELPSAMVGILILLSADPCALCLPSAELRDLTRSPLICGDPCALCLPSAELRDLTRSPLICGDPCALCLPSAELRDLTRSPLICAIRALFVAISRASRSDSVSIDLWRFVRSLSAISRARDLTRSPLICGDSCALCLPSAELRDLTRSPLICGDSCALCLPSAELRDLTRSPLICGDPCALCLPSAELRDLTRSPLICRLRSFLRALGLLNGLNDGDHVDYGTKRHLDFAELLKFDSASTQSSLFSLLETLGSAAAAKGQIPGTIWSMSMMMQLFNPHAILNLKKKKEAPNTTTEKTPNPWPKPEPTLKREPCRTDRSTEYRLSSIGTALQCNTEALVVEGRPGGGRLAGRLLKPNCTVPAALGRIETCRVPGSRPKRPSLENNAARGVFWRTLREKTHQPTYQYLNVNCRMLDRVWLSAGSALWVGAETGGGSGGGGSAESAVCWRWRSSSVSAASRQRLVWWRSRAFCWRGWWFYALDVEPDEYRAFELCGRPPECWSGSRDDKGHMGSFSLLYLVDLSLLVSTDAVVKWPGPGSGLVTSSSPSNGTLSSPCSKISWSPAASASTSKTGVASEVCLVGGGRGAMVTLAYDRKSPPGVAAAAVATPTLFRNAVVAVPSPSPPQPPRRCRQQPWTLTAKHVASQVTHPGRDSLEDGVRDVWRLAHKVSGRQQGYRLYDRRVAALFDLGAGQASCGVEHFLAVAIGQLAEPHPAGPAEVSGPSLASGCREKDSTTWTPTSQTSTGPARDGGGATGSTSRRASASPLPRCLECRPAFRCIGRSSAESTASIGVLTGESLGKSRLTYPSREQQWHIRHSRLCSSRPGRADGLSGPWGWKMTADDPGETGGGLLVIFRPAGTRFLITQPPHMRRGIKGEVDDLHRGGHGSPAAAATRPAVPRRRALPSLRLGRHPPGGGDEDLLSCRLTQPQPRVHKQDGSLSWCAFQLAGGGPDGRTSMRQQKALPPKWCMAMVHKTAPQKKVQGERAHRRPKKKQQAQMHLKQAHASGIHHTALAHAEVHLPGSPEAGNTTRGPASRRHPRHRRDLLDRRRGPVAGSRVTIRDVEQLVIRQSLANFVDHLASGLDDFVECFAGSMKLRCLVWLEHRVVEKDQITGLELLGLRQVGIVRVSQLLMKVQTILGQLSGLVQTALEVLDIAGQISIFGQLFQRVVDRESEVTAKHQINRDETYQLEIGGLQRLVWLGAKSTKCGRGEALVGERDAVHHLLAICEDRDISIIPGLQLRSTKPIRSLWITWSPAVEFLIGWSRHCKNPLHKSPLYLHGQCDLVPAVSLNIGYDFEIDSKKTLVGRPLGLRWQHISHTRRCMVQNPSPNASLEVQMHFRVHGSTGNLFGDGMAFWYIDPAVSKFSGPVFGMQDKFRGLGVLLDTYSNHNGPHSHDHPYISAMVNNGSLAYDHDRDGTHSQLDGCTARFRNRDHDTLLSIRYVNNALLVATDIENKQTWQPCFRVPNVKLPTHFVFGVSAMTGDLSDNHDLLSVKVYEIEPKEPLEDNMGVDYRTIEPSADSAEPPRPHVDSQADSGWSFLRIFLLVLFCAIGLVTLLVLGLVYHTSQQRKKKRFY